MNTWDTLNLFINVLQKINDIFYNIIMVRKNINL